jgi:hypothetical protein
MTELDPFVVPVATHDLASVPCRSRVVVEGTVGSVTASAWVGGPVTEVSLVDATDALTLVFFGRRTPGGLHPGRRLVAAGSVGTHDRQRVILSPQLWLVPQEDGGATDAAVPELVAAL